MHLEKVAHHVREKLDEIKRKEVNRLRMLAKERMKQMQGTEVLKFVAQHGGMPTDFIYYRLFLIREFAVLSFLVNPFCFLTHSQNYIYIYISIYTRTHLIKQKAPKQNTD